MNETVNIKVNNSSEDLGASILKSIMLAKTGVPYSHKTVADNYIIIKRIYKNHTVRATVALSEYDLLKKYAMEPLESTTISKANSELEQLQKWSVSNASDLRDDADRIITIRAKELKNITANAYSRLENEMFNGYKAIEKYFEEITKFYK